MSELIRMKAFDQVVETTMQTNIKSVWNVKDIIDLNIFSPQSQKPQIS